MPRVKQYVMYSKICIVCQNGFETTRVNTLCCKKQCRNRLRYLPQHMINVLIQRVSMFTTFKTYGNAIVSAPNVRTERIFTASEIAQAQADANAIAASRGIFKTDPALGGADGFGIKYAVKDLELTKELQELHEDIKIEAQPYDNNNGTVESSGDISSNIDSSNGNDSQENSTGGLASIKRNRLRRLGGVK